MSDWVRLQELFSLGRRLPHEERRRFVERHLAREPELADELEQLLFEDADDTRSTLLDGPLLVSEPALTAGEEAERIGRYRLIERLGEGGMGSVWEAEQTDPIVRRVALKLVRVGLERASVVARFEAERQALAQLEHPGIASIFDGGTTAQGRPWLAMELVEGKPLCEYARARSLGEAERIRLFVQVCEAVQYAHSKGVLHRDLKASNVLVRTAAPSAQPVLIDFGLACARDPQARPESESEAFSGSLGSMSPEQARGDAYAIDTRTDVYGLGCLLYELLTDRPPFPAERYAGRALSEVREEIVQRELAAPDPHLERREVGWIVQRALANDPAQRYASAQGLGQDLRRLLAGDRVEAVPDSTAYRLRVALRRHRAAFATAGAAVAGLLLAILVLLRANREAELAAQTEERLAAEALEEAGRTRAMHEFVLSTLELAELGLAPSRDLTVRDLLVGASERLAQAFEDRPKEMIELRMALGRALYSLGEHEVAAREAARALELVEAGGELHGAWEFQVLCLLARIHADSAGHEEIEYSYRAQMLAAEALRQRDAALGEQLDKVLMNAFNLPREELENGLGLAMQRAREVIPPGDPLWPMMADLLEFTGGYIALAIQSDSSLLLLEQSIALRHELDDPQALARARRTWIEVLLRRDEALLAQAAVRENLEQLRSEFPSDHWLIWDAQSQLLAARSMLGELDELPDALDDAYAAILEARGETSMRAIEAGARRLAHLRRVGELDLARQASNELARSLAVARNAPSEWGLQSLTLDPATDLVHAQMQGLAALSLEEPWRPGMPAAYLERMRGAVSELVRQAQADFAEDDPRRLLVARQLSSWAFYLVLAQADNAALLRGMSEDALRVLAPFEQQLPASVGDALVGLCAARLLEGDVEQALELSERAIELYEDCKPAGSLPTLTSRSVRAHALQRLGRTEEARAELNRALEETRRFLPGEPSLKDLERQLSALDRPHEP